MPARSLPCLLTVGLALLLSPPASADPAAVAKATVAAKAPQPRTDLNGDPLPSGAVARLGAARLCQQSVYFLAFSPDDKIVAALDANCLRLWNVQTGRELRHFDDPLVHASPPPNLPLAFSSDGSIVALICGGNTIRVWDVAAGREIHTLQDSPVSPSDLAMDPKGRFLAAGGNGMPIYVWDLKDGKRLLSCDAVFPLNWMTFSADGARLIVSAEVRTNPTDPPAAKLWHFNVADGKRVRELTPSFDEGGRGAVCLDGTIFAAPTKDGATLHLLSTSDGKELRRTEGKADHPEQVCFSGDGRYLTASSGDGTVRVWDASTGKVAHEVKALASGVERVALSHDGKLVAAAGPADDAIHIWDLEKSKELLAFAGHRSGPLSVVFSKDGKSVFTTNREGAYTNPSRPAAEWSLREWEAATGRERRVTKEDLKGKVLYADFSRDGRLLAAVTDDGTLHLRDVAAGKELRHWPVPVVAAAFRRPDGQIEKRTQADIREPQFSLDGRFLFAGGNRDASIHRWDTTTGEELAMLKAPQGFLPSIPLPAPDGKNLLVTETGQSAAHMTLVDGETGQMIRKLWEGNSQRYTWDLSPDGRTLAVSDGSPTAFVEVASGRARGKLEGDVGKTVNLTYSPDGRLLAIVGDGEVRLWRVAAGVLGCRLEGCGAQPDCLAFSPDGKRLAVSEKRNTVLIYDVDAIVVPVLPPDPLTEKEFAGLWDDLSAADGARAYLALRRLAADPDRVVAFVKARWKPAPELDGPRMDRLLTELDDDDFAVRENASEELIRHSPKSEEAMRRALRGEPSAEVRHRIVQIMEDLRTAPTWAPSPELVNLRVVELLEACGTDTARGLLKKLADRPEDALWARDARAALERLERRAGNPP